MYCKMNNNDRLIAEYDRKQYLVLQEQYFDNKRRIQEISIYEVQAKIQINLNIARISQELRLLDRKLKDYYEENKQPLYNQPATVDEMATGRRIRKLGNHSDKVRYITIHYKAELEK